MKYMAIQSTPETITTEKINTILTEAPEVCALPRILKCQDWP